MSTAADNLQAFLDTSFKDLAFPPLGNRETEPAYTARCITPLVVKLLKNSVSTGSLVISGDGGKSRAFSREFLGSFFHPDIAVAEEQTRYWCAEVKLLRGSSNGNAIATALGQALIYSSVFPRVTVILVDQNFERRPMPNMLVNHNEWLSILTIRNFSK